MARWGRPRFRGSESNAQAQPPKKAQRTPYQGKHKSFGYFNCPVCRNEWQSGHSWANFGQQCLYCRINVYPYKQRPLEKVGIHDDYRNSGKPHQQKLCQKCRYLGYCCSRLDNYDYDYDYE